jgi:hypothetical protein
VNTDSGFYDRERELLSRPFLDRPRPSPYSDAPSSPVSDPSVQNVRPYLMTGGRTGAVSADGTVAVAMETVVVLSWMARNGPVTRQAFERGRILRDCRQPRSVAEIAARLHLPLGVVTVLVIDLLADGLLDAATAQPEQQSHDVDFLERLIAGVSAL